MSTNLLTPNSPNDPLSPSDDELKTKLNELHTGLTDRGVSVDDLLICFIATNEMILGEINDPETYRSLDPSTLRSRGSIMEHGEFIAVRNPKRVLRLTLNSPHGIMPQLVFSDFDLIDQGMIEVKPLAAFFLSWTNFTSQLSYCAMYLNWFKERDEEMQKARARASGIVTDVDQSTAGKIAKLQERLTRR